LQSDKAVVSAGYAYYCPECDEDFYGVEVMDIKQAVLALRTDEGDSNPEYDRALLEVFNLLTGANCENLEGVEKCE